MILRPRQKEFVQRCCHALNQHGNTLGVAPTGAGKTIMLSSFVGERLVSLAAANDWLNSNESDSSAHKSKRWLEQSPTEKQLAILPHKYRMDYSLTRYKASVLLTFQFNRNKIRDLVFSAAKGQAA
jgi:hypothetical protein